MMLDEHRNPLFSIYGLVRGLSSREKKKKRNGVEEMERVMRNTQSVNHHHRMYVQFTSSSTINKQASERAAINQIGAKAI